MYSNLGPSNSHDMIVWLKSGYFSESLLLRTEKDDENEFHTLQEWCRICGNNVCYKIKPNV
jgi:hypothetical protein